MQVQTSLVNDSKVRPMCVNNILKSNWKKHNKEMVCVSSGDKNHKWQFCSGFESLHDFTECAVYARGLFRVQ